MPSGKPQPPAAMIRSVIEGVYDDYMRAKFKNYEQRQQDLEQLGQLLRRDSRDTGEFLSQLALVSGVDTDERPAAAPAGTRERDAHHGASGQGAGVAAPSSPSGWRTGCFRTTACSRSGDEEALEEERRLFYVTVTRAKDELVSHLSRDVLSGARRERSPAAVAVHRRTCRRT